MKINKLVAVVSAFATSLGALFFIAAPHAFAATATWTGAGIDTNMNTAGNWGGVAPVAGDDLVFPANITNRTVVNNYAGGTSFNSITFSGAATVSSSYTLSGNGLIVVAGITSSMTGTYAGSQVITAPLTLGGIQSFTTSGGGTLNINVTLNTATYNLTFVAEGYNTIYGVISGSGNLIKTGAGALFLGGNNSAYTGAITASNGQLIASGANALFTSGGTTVADGADLDITGCGVAAYNGNITVTGASSIPSGINLRPKLSISNIACAGGGATDETYGIPAGINSATFSGNIALSTDITFATRGKDATLTGSLSGAHAIKMLDGYGGKLIVSGSANTTLTPNGTYNAAPIIKTLSDALPNSTVSISGSSVITIDGTRKDVTLFGALATLKGTGTLASLSAQDGATVAPGHSPGTLTITGALTFVGNPVYEAEIKNTTEYDQIKAGSVDLAANTAILKVILYAGFSIKAADTFTIISNTGSNPVTGTFKDLAEGATFPVGDGVFKITYKGGDGNDVVLSVVTVPKVGNTGFKLLTSSPVAMMAATVAITAGAYVISRRYATAKIK